MLLQIIIITNRKFYIYYFNLFDNIEKVNIIIKNVFSLNWFFMQMEAI